MASRVLIIDDDRLAQKLYSDHLLPVGYAVETADTGEDGLALIGRQRFDVLVTDLLLPGIDGLEVLAKARNLDPDLGIIVISALDVVDPAVRAIKAGAFDYLVKPFGAEALCLSVRRCIDYRALLFENMDLKHHLALSEAGARIASTQDYDSICHQAAEALALHMNARLTLLMTDSGGERRVQSAVGSGPPLDPEVVARLTSTLSSQSDEGITGATALPENLGLGNPVKLPVATPGAGMSVLVFPGKAGEFDQGSLRAGTFLVQHLGQALQALNTLEAARHLAYVDDLTQLFNSRYLQRVLDRHVESSQSKGHSFAVLFIDLDRFKSVNDQHGHLVGSDLLVKVSEVIKDCIRDGDTATRYGGDEYVIVLPQSDQGSALKVAERIRRRIEQQDFVIAGVENVVQLTASVGVACYPEHTTDKRMLIELADQAMYRGKRGNRNVVYLATPQAPSDQSKREN